MNFKELNVKASRKWRNGDLTVAYSLYSEMLKIAKTDEEIKICRESLTIIHSEMIHADKEETKLTKILKEIVKAQFLILTMFFLTSFGKYDNTCFELVYESNDVKVYKNINIIDTLTNLHKDVVKHVAVLDYQYWEPYTKPRPKTKPLYNINEKTSY